MNNQGYGNQGPYANNQPFINNPYPAPPRPQNPYNQVPAGNYQAFPPPPNQGYLPPNQAYLPPPQNQGFLPNNQGFVHNLLVCPGCNRETPSIARRAPGGVTWIWCFALFLFTGICCCIPFCVDCCKDTVISCSTCQRIKGREEANCC